jgi:myo-inositol-1-phosphate synthase
MSPSSPPGGAASSPSATGARRTGVWLVGACGGVGTLTVAGARAVARGLRPPVGLLTETPLFAGLDLPPLSDLVFGGHEVRDTDFGCSASEFARRAGVIDEPLLALLREDLERASGDLRPGYLVDPSPAVRALAQQGRVARATTPRAVVEGVQRDLRDFQARHGLETVVVVNVSSTEPPRGLPIEYGDLASFRAVLERRSTKGLTSGVLHAYAAIDAGFPFVNFTPSPANTVPALVALAAERGVPHMGNDGKTGETLVKTVLAPLFVGRAMRVLSWEGYNLLGNRDGQVLDDPEAKASKTRSKDVALRSILRDPSAHTKVTIDYVPSIDDWKVAWDFVHFEGFLGARMSMQFTWQGNDSALAAPLVLDLARLAAFARSSGESGLLPHLAGYFKSPAGVDEHSFVKQMEALEAYVARHRAKATATDVRKG